jgi:hypothetical protein
VDTAAKDLVEEIDIDVTELFFEIKHMAVPVAHCTTEARGAARYHAVSAVSAVSLPWYHIDPILCYEYLRAINRPGGKP